MIFDIKTSENSSKYVEDYKKIMKELDGFYELNWIHHTPNVFFVESREQIDAIWGTKTDKYIIGWTNTQSDVYALKQEKIEGESSHKPYSDELYRMFIKHELSHCFCKAISQANYIPKWFWEGVAIFTSGQLKFKDRPKRFTNFLNHYEHSFDSEVYSESGFVIEALCKKFGKEGILNILKNLERCRNKEDFEALFKKQYNQELSYEYINSLVSNP